MTFTITLRPYPRGPRGSRRRDGRFHAAQLDQGVEAEREVVRLSDRPTDRTYRWYADRTDRYRPAEIYRLAGIGSECDARRHRTRFRSALPRRAPSPVERDLASSGDVERTLALVREVRRCRRSLHRSPTNGRPGSRTSRGDRRGPGFNGAVVAPAWPLPPARRTRPARLPSR